MLADVSFTNEIRAVNESTVIMQLFDTEGAMPPLPHDVCDTMLGAGPSMCEMLP